jgi:putative restriction endonuclease
MSTSRMKEFFLNEDWDTPFFKRLAHNDTGQAVGHQGGVVLPKDLRQFFPTLDEAQTSAAAPTTDRSLRVELYLAAGRVAETTVRYQIQTWGGTRLPESRITDNLTPLRNRAAGGDLLVFQRRADAFDRFRLILLKQSTPEFTEVNSMTGGRRWGVLEIGEQPVTQRELVEAQKELVTLADKPFELLKTQVSRIETRQNRIARSSIFRERVRAEYERRCCVSGISVATPTAIYEVESAHVVPLNKGGSDDIRNGVTLTQTVHWAFDRGLFGILPNRTIYIPRRVKRMTENSFLKQFEGKPIIEAKTSNLRVHDEAIRWHFETLVKQWD